MHKFAFCSFKGGTSKTSTAMHLGACLARFHKKKVLLVDFDSQANLSIGLGIGPDSLKTLVPVLQGQETIENIIHPTSIKNLSLIPANAYLDGIERRSGFPAGIPYSLRLVHPRRRGRLQTPGWGDTV